MRQQELLLVDDNIDLADNISEILTEEGFKVGLFYNPKRALDAFLPGCYTLALLDLRMPEMDGIELYRRLKEKEPLLGAILLSAYASVDQTKAAIREGVLAVLLKPINIVELIAKLTSAINGKDTRSHLLLE